MIKKMGRPIIRVLPRSKLKSKFRKYFEGLDAEERQLLAGQCGVKLNYLEIKVMNLFQKPSRKLIEKLEAALEGKVNKSQIRSYFMDNE